MNIFSHFKSRCAISRSCRYSTALIICLKWKVLFIINFAVIKLLKLFLNHQIIDVMYYELKSSSISNNGVGQLILEKVQKLYWKGRISKFHQETWIHIHCGRDKISINEEVKTKKLTQATNEERWIIHLLAI